MDKLSAGQRHKKAAIKHFVNDIWMNDHQLRVSARNRGFDIEFEMEIRAEFEPEDYVAEMWTEDNEYVRAGYLDVTYMVSMNAFVYDEDERKWI